MSRDEGMGMGGKSGGGSSGNSGNGGDNRESYGAVGQYSGGTTSTQGNGDTPFDRPNIAQITGPTLPGATLDLGNLDPDPYVDLPLSKRDTITSFTDNLLANVKSNPYSALAPVTTLTKTAIQTALANAMLGNFGTPSEGDNGGNNNGDGQGDGGLSRDQINTLVPYLPFEDTMPESQVLKFFSNNPFSMNSSNLQTDYNNAKNNVNSILGINQQFGYSTQPYGGLMATNLQDNPFNIEYMRTRGLI